MPEGSLEQGYRRRLVQNNSSSLTPCYILLQKESSFEGQTLKTKARTKDGLQFPICSVAITEAQNLKCSNNNAELEIHN